MPESIEVKLGDRKLELFKEVLMEDLGLTQEDLDKAWKEYKQKRQL